MDFEFFLKVAGDFLLAAVIFWAAIPAGLALGLSPLVTGLVVASGAFTSVVVVVFAGDALRKFLLRWREKRLAASPKPLSPVPEKETRPPGFFRRLWDRWGLIGIALSAPLTTGTIGGTILVVALGSRRGPILLWFGVGIVFWTVVLVGAISLGISVFK